MAGHRPSPEPTEDDIRRGYEIHGITIRSYVMVIVGFVLTAAVIHTVVWFVMQAFEQPRPGIPTGLTYLSPEKREIAPPPEPRLQPSPSHESMPWQDVSNMKRIQEATLMQRGWTRNTVTGRLEIPREVIAKVGSFVESSRRESTKLPASSGVSGMAPPSAVPLSDIPPPGSTAQEGITLPPPAPQQSGGPAGSTTRPVEATQPNGGQP